MTTHTPWVSCVSDWLVYLQPAWSLLLGMNLPCHVHACMDALWLSGQDGVYDNVAAKGRPQKKKGGGMDEDVYGSLGEGGEGIYDDTRGGKGMRYSEDGLYDNPHSMGEFVVCAH